MLRSGRLTAIVVLVVSLLLVVAGLILLVRPDSIPERMILVVDLSEDLPEETRRGVLSSFLGRDLTVFELVRTLTAAAEDERVKGVNTERDSRNRVTLISKPSGWPKSIDPFNASSTFPTKWPCCSCWPETKS